jgi:hypothetical protein
MSLATRHFLRHYLEMVVAMFAGMAVLWTPASWVVRTLGGWSDLHAQAPAAMFLVMATTMTAPMVGWMLYRGHGWRANAAMSASMFLPTFAAIGLLWTDAVGDVGTLMAAEHVAMLACMLGVMLARPDEYRHAHRRVEVAA